MADATKMRPPIARLPESRLHSLIAGAFRRGAEQERAGEIKSTEGAYALSEHHARRIVEEFVAAGFVEIEADRGAE